MATKYYDDHFSIPDYQHPEVIKAIRDLWSHQGFGKNETESVVSLHSRKADGHPIIKQQPDAFTSDKEKFSIAPGDTAIIHNHPIGKYPKPAPADTAIADKFGVDMYTISKDGLYRYSPVDKKTTLVQPGTNFDKWDTGAIADSSPDVSSLPVSTRTDPYVVAIGDKTVQFPAHMSEDEVENAAAQIHSDSQAQSAPSDQPEPTPQSQPAQQNQ